MAARARARARGAAGFRGAVCQPCRAFSPEVAVAIAGGLTGAAVGVGVPIFFNAQSDKAEERPNVDNCFPCQATGSVPCRFCENGSGTITVTLGDGTTEETECLNCEGRGAMTCPTCSGSGLQPRYLDRRVYADND